MRAAVAGEEPASWATTRARTPALDVSAGVAAQLRRAGVDVRTLEGCTVEDARLFSYRRDHVTGRFAGLVWLRGPGTGP
jgi:copper oxidase (laccase) domain-containing protein